jgi:Integrase core domain
LGLVIEFGTFFVLKSIGYSLFLPLEISPVIPDRQTFSEILGGGPSTRRRRRPVGWKPKPLDAVAAAGSRPVHPSRHSRPHSLGQWPEFVAKAVQQWIAAFGAETAYIEPGSQWENGYVESFNARLRAELLNGEIFYTLRETQIIIESWRRHYNPASEHPSVMGPIVRMARWGMPSSQFALMQSAKKRAAKIEAKGGTVEFKELLRMEPDCGIVTRV